MNRKFVSGLTLDVLLKFIRYEPETGDFYRLVKTSRSAPVGLIENKKTPFGYMVIAVKRQRYLAHRLAWLYMTGNLPSGIIDHINGDRCDNRFSNLRDSTNSVNQQNIVSPRGKNKYLGVYFHKRHNLFSAQIVTNGKRKCLGYFKNPEEASDAYWAAKYEFHGVAHERMTSLGIGASKVDKQG